MSAIQPLPLVEPLASSLDAVNAFLRLSSLPHVVFFDSAMRHPQLGRYSFVAADPVEWISMPADDSDAMKNFGLRIADCGLKTDSPNPKSEIRNPKSSLPPFVGGWAGMFGYELAGSLERVPAAEINEFQLPALAVGLYDVVVAFDHQQQAAWLISQGIPETDPNGAAPTSVRTHGQVSSPIVWTLPHKQR